MSEENKIRDAADAVRGVLEAAPIYQDLAQPTVQGMGKELVLVVRAVHVALAPIRAMVWSFERIEEYVTQRTAELLKNTPPEQIAPPPAHVAVPAMLALSYTAEEPVLREMYARLLASAMDKRSVKRAHPAFVEIIKQLSPDEALLVRLFAKDRAFPLISLASIKPGSGMHYLVRNFSMLGVEAKCAHAELTPSYLDNLQRLGLIEIREHGYVQTELYTPLEQHGTIRNWVKAIQEAERTPHLEHQGLLVTDFGKQFIAACVKERD